LGAVDFIVVAMADGKTIRRDLDVPRLSIGRSSRNDLVIPDLSLSRVHAEIWREGERFFVKDAGSKNGTLLNGRQIREPSPLAKGDQITLGQANLWFNSEPQGKVELTEQRSPVSATAVYPVEQLITDPATLSGGTVAAPQRGGALPLDILQRAGEQLVATAPLDDLLRSIMDLVFESVRPERGFLMLLDPATGQLEPKVVRTASGGADQQIALSRHIADLVVTGKQSVLTSDALHDPRFEHGDSIVAQGIRSAMCVPLWNSREVIGLVYADSRLRSNSFTPSDLRILTSLANVAAVKIENNRLFEQTVQARALERDLELAATIQRYLMPRSCPPVPGYEIAGTNLPCRTVGGDTYDFLPRPGERLWVAVGDVSGKGLPAAMIMSHFQAMLRGLAEADRPLSQIVGRLNDYLARTLASNQFISLFVAELEPEGGLVRYVNAGHNLPLLLCASGEVRRLSGSGPVLGVLPGMDYSSAETHLAPGDTLLLYSDGATESQDPRQQEFGEERLIENLRQVAATDPETALTRLEEAILGFCGVAPRYDDITLLLVRRRAA
jgi:serine phosphatase RsbU (regulator of sigma subunit)